MPIPRTTPLAALLAIAALALGGAGCSTDDAAERDVRDAAEEVENSDVGKEAGEAADDAGRAIEQGVEDVDGN